MDHFFVLVNKKVHLFRFLFFILSSILIIYPLLSPLFTTGIPWTYDGDLHQFRMAGFHSAIKDGQIPPRWSSMLSYGWGSPVFNFNWSLPYWLSEPFLFAGWSTTAAQKMVVASAIPLSYLTMFAFLALWLGFWPAIAGSTIYIWANFRIYLLYTSGASGMEVGFIFWPLLFLPVLLIEKRKYVSAFLLTSTATALIMLSHQVMFLMIQPLFWSFVILRQFQVKHRSIFLKTICSFGIGLLISAYFWLPAIAEKQYIHIGETVHNYVAEFLSPLILFLQPGLFTLPGDNLWKYIYGTGWIVLLVVGISIIRFIVRRDSVRLLFIVFFILAEFLITPYSLLFWKIIPLLPQFIYPVRFQALALFCASILTGFLLKKNKYAPQWSLILIILILILNIRMIPQNPKRTNWNDEYYFYGDSTSDMYGEFLPKTTNSQHFFATPSRYERHDIGRIISGNGTISNTEKRSSSASFSVHAQSDVTVVLNQLDFPGWTVRANDMPVTIKPNTYGEMLFTLPPGLYQIEAAFNNTPIRSIGNVLSFTGVIFLLSYVLYNTLHIRRMVKFHLDKKAPKKI